MGIIREGNGLKASKRAYTPYTNGWWRRLLNLFSSKHLPSRSYRYLARQLARDFGHIDGGCHVAVTSPGSLDVSTDALLMLAYFMQDELDARVLLVDATLRHDGVAGRLGFGTAPGFADVLANPAGPALALVRQSPRPNIFVLPAGDVVGSAVSTIKREMLESLFRQFKDRFDYVLVQHGSVTRDTRYMPVISLADVVMLLVEERTTMMGDMETCLKCFRDHGLDNVRLVLSSPR